MIPESPRPDPQPQIELTYHQLHALQLHFIHRLTDGQAAKRMKIKRAAFCRLKNRGMENMHQLRRRVGRTAAAQLLGFDPDVATKSRP